MTVKPLGDWLCHGCGKKLDSLELDPNNYPKDMVDQDGVGYAICKTWPNCCPTPPQTAAAEAPPKDAP